jgi:hypothetical protein
MRASPTFAVPNVTFGVKPHTTLTLNANKWRPESK